MNSIDRLAEVLRRDSFEVVVNRIHEADPWGSFTFSRLNPEGVWKVSSEYNYIVLNAGWPVDEFNAEYHRRETPGGEN